MVPDKDPVLAIKDVTAILQPIGKPVYSMARNGELPAFKVRGQWVAEQARAAKPGVSTKERK